MARLRRKSSRQGAPYWNRASQPLASHLEPATPEADLPLTPDRDHKGFSGFFAFWPNKTSPVTTEALFDSARLKDVPIDISRHQLLTSPIADDPSRQYPRVALCPRLPRHVPIIIPDFAQPFSPGWYPPSLVSDTDDQLTPRIGSDSRLLAAANANPFHLDTPQSYSEERVRPAPTTLPTMNDSQTSLSASESGPENGSSAFPPATNGGGNVGISPGVLHQNPNATNLSGLVCNVHRTTGQEPHALVGATTTILGDKLYVFGGRIHSRTRPQLTSDLYELDLIRRHWTKLDTLGDIPPPRYFHSVCGLGDSKLVCYGGMSPSNYTRAPASGQPAVAKPNGEQQPEVVVMSDIHVFDVRTSTWTLISSSDDPQGRYAHCATIVPSSAVFASANAPLSAIQHNPPSSDPHSGTLGVQLDGTGGAEMVVVGGQDSANNYIEQISVFNLRSLKWTGTTTWDRKCGAYKSMVAPLTGMNADNIGQGTPLDDTHAPRNGTAVLIYSNYNFLDVKLELQLRLPDGTLIEQPMAGPVTPPGLRFPNGGVIDQHFVVSGTYLTASKHEYALWALDLRTLSWGRIDTAGTVFGQGSWNRGVLWKQRNAFVILGHRKRSLVDDYNHRRINFSHICVVELEAFGLYDNPRKTNPASGYVSRSAPAIPASLQPGLASQSAGGRPYSNTADKLGVAALSLPELADMELVALGGERIPCNSHLLSRRWGPYFNQLLLESATLPETTSMSDAATLRPHTQQTSRNSSITITPSVANGISGSGASVTESILDPQRSLSRSTTRTLVELPIAASVPASSRPRSLYLPHMVQTLQLLLHYLYTSALPRIGSPLCSPHTLCSLLQMARPYQVDGLLEATVERLHEVLDGRNAAAVFNAAAMAAGGGRGVGPGHGDGGLLALLERRDSAVGVDAATQASAAHTTGVPTTTPGALALGGGPSGTRQERLNGLGGLVLYDYFSFDVDGPVTDGYRLVDGGERRRGIEEGARGTRSMDGRPQLGDWTAETRATRIDGRTADAGASQHHGDGGVVMDRGP